MSTKKPTAEQRAPRVALCERGEHKFLCELERLILAGYRINFQEQFCLLPGCLIATVDLPA